MPIKFTPSGISDSTSSYPDCITVDRSYQSHLCWFEATLSRYELAQINMANTSRITDAPPAAVEEALKRLGRNIRTARLRRRLRIEDVAQRMGASRFTLADVEKGKPGASAAAYLGALWALGLLEQITDVADPDRDDEGKVLESARAPSQAPRRQSLDNDF